MLRIDKENQKKQGLGFFKLDKEAIIVVQEDLVCDLYELATSHKEEFVYLMEDYDARHRHGGAPRWR